MTIKEEFWKENGYPKKDTQNSQIIDSAMDFVLQRFWDEIQKKNYITMVTGYKDNQFDKLLQQFNLKHKCRHCGRTFQ